MKYINKKLFYKTVSSKRIFSLFNYDGSEYYELLEKKKNQGYVQLILNSKFMIDFIKCFNTENFWVYEIKLIQDDTDYATDLNKLLKSIKREKNKLILSQVIKHLDILYSTNSIEIEKISLSNNNNKDMSIYSNGVFKLSQNDSENFSNDIIEKVSDITK